MRFVIFQRFGQTSTACSFITVFIFVLFCCFYIFVAFCYLFFFKIFVIFIFYFNFLFAIQLVILIGTFILGLILDTLITNLTLTLSTTYTPILCIITPHIPHGRSASSIRIQDLITGYRLDLISIIAAYIVRQIRCSFLTLVDYLHCGV